MKWKKKSIWKTGDLLDSIILSVHEAVQNGTVNIEDLPDSTDDNFSDNFSSIVQKLTNGISI